MNDDFVNAFRKATTSVFEMMLGLEVNDGAVDESSALRPRSDISGIIGLSGGATGNVVISLDKPLAMEITGRLLGDKPATIDEDVIDTVGELTNMIAGAAKGELPQYGMNLALPSVVFGKGDFHIGSKSSVTATSISFETECGNLLVEYSLAGKTAPVVAGV